MLKILSFVASSIVMLAATQAYALNARTWISGRGADEAGCGPIASPCRTLQYAHDATNAGGEINVLDPAGYGAVSINKAISIINDGVGVAGVLAPAGGNAISIFAPLDADVVLRGLTIEGAGAGRNGVVFLRAGSLTIANCLVQGFVGASDGAGNGIRLAHTSGTPDIVVSNTTVANNGYVGLYYNPQSTPAKVTFDHVKAFNNQYGISVTATTPATSVGLINHVAIIDSLASNNSVRGFEVIGPTGGSYYAADVLLLRSTATQNQVGIYQRNSVINIDATVSRQNRTYPAGDLQSESGYVYSMQNNSIEFPSKAPTGTKSQY